MGKFNITISEFVIEKLKNRKEGDSGSVYVVESGEVLSVVAITLPGKEEDFDESDSGLPFGLACRGSFHCTTDFSGINCDADLRIVVDPSSKDVSAFFLEGSSYEPKKYIIIGEADIAHNFYLIRVRASLPVVCELSDKGVREMVERLRFSTHGAVRLAELSAAPLDRPLSFPVNKGYSRLADIDILECKLQLKLAEELDNDEPRKSILIDCVTRSLNCCSFNLNMDSISFIPRNEKLKDVIEHYVEVNLRRCFTLAENCLLQQLNEPTTLSAPEFYHFLPQGCGHFVTVVYPKKMLDRDLSHVRAKFHAAYDLPTDRPLFMRGNSFHFSPAVASNGEIENPHLNVKPSGIVNGEPAVVQGRYAYHHYCQGGMDDDGWGCAYRSLQTLCSWFRLQGYTNRSVPTLKEIQECLVSIGDKPSSFVGSRQWIGSTEVGFCLDTLLGISCRIISVSSGDEMSMKGGELSYHFKTQETPVMIGGGNLAHTILGVDYNKKTGDIKFLILDPHYTGAEDISTIISKGWCGWKGPEFWKKGSFYNMCMPIRPKCL